MSRTNANLDDQTQPRFQPAQTPADVRLEPGGVVDVEKDGKNNWGVAARWFLLALLLVVLVWGLLAIAR